MKRRDLILASGGILVPALGRGAQPCLPPHPSGPEASTAMTGCAQTSGGFYSTTFPLEENPISERGMWVTGKSVGVDWHDAQTIPGKAYASENADAQGSRYADAIAHLSTSYRSFNANQYAQGTVYRARGYAPIGSKHEIELLLRFEITAHNARGYEILWGWDGDFSIERWNGPTAKWTPLFEWATPGPGRLADGDVIRAKIVGNIISVFRNGTLVKAIDITNAGGTNWYSGQPGMGFWPVDAAVKENYGWRSYEAGDL
jgi:hypothetical protein